MSPNPSTLRHRLLKSALSQFNRLRRLAELNLRNRAPFAIAPASRRVFFPGCSLPATDPELVVATLERLQTTHPETTLWSACCGRPLTQFSGPGTADPIRAGLIQQIRDSGVTEIVTACGNCQTELGFLLQEFPELRILNLYHELAQQEWPVQSSVAYAVHHPCPARIDKSQRRDFLELAEASGLELLDPTGPHKLACCLVKGAGAQARRQILAGQEMVTYCAHCTGNFQRDIPTRHVLQILLGSTRRWLPVSKVRQFIAWFRLRKISR